MRRGFWASLVSSGLVALAGGLLLVGALGCETLAGLGEACTVDGDCDGAKCHNKICFSLSPKAVGTACTNKAECKSLVCESGKCAAGTAATDAICLSNDECKSGNCESGKCALRAVGAACTTDAECKSTICYSSKCAAKCTKKADCTTSGDECRSDDGKRMLCVTPKFNKDIGKACAPSYSCPSGLTCGPYNATAPVAHAYCTTECKTDLDCPSTFLCAGETKKTCIPKGFCNACLIDDDCPSSMKCVSSGSEKFCSRPCTVGKSDCDRYATCKTAGDGNAYCMHAAGSCLKAGALCDPCFTSKDCKSNAMCLTNYTKERFCTQSCSSGSCPTGYTCYSDKAGTIKTQCVPDTTKKTCFTTSAMMEVGATMVDFAMVAAMDSDKNGSLMGETKKIVRLSDFASTSKVILFNLSAGWCSPCLSETKQFNGLMTKYESKGLMIYQVLYDGAARGTTPTLTLIDQWINLAGNPKGVIGIDPARVAGPYNTKGSTPMNMLIDAKTLKVLDKWNGFSASSLETKLAKYL